MPNMMIRIGDSIRKERELRGLSRPELASQTGVPETTIKRAETSERISDIGISMIAQN